MDVIKETEKKMNAALEHLKQEFRGLRTGRANPGIVENVQVEVYGTSIRIRDLATISAEQRQLMVMPHDAKNVPAIAKAIDGANLNVRAVPSGNGVVVKFPEMDESVRKEIVKVARKKCEDAKVGIRNARRDGNELLKKQKANGDISEDVMKKSEKKIQELTDKSCTLADKLTEEKEKEITTV